VDDKCRRMAWTGLVVFMGEKTNAYRVLVGKLYEEQGFDGIVV
jgi:hypothetical protein